MSDQHDNIDWSLTTWEGSRRAQLRRWCSLSLAERFRALEEMTDVAQCFEDMRAQGRFKDLSKLNASGNIQEQDGDYAPAFDKKNKPDKPDK